eukprot:TRINITY_DN5028_c0_g1_i1.p1 TRINITY_DN5028_c0_g1~~TRINITY_DN5028_c0_g1_i1.p1  ORF type:complete len:340 (-),score=66.64 TRINITY_DN5028_c0_g1_i1:201-1220(-)
MSESLPIVDIGPYTAGPLALEEKLRIAKQLDQACRTWGFFYVKGHGIEEGLIQKVRELAREFFSQTTEEKSKISIYNSDKARGYQKLAESVTKGKADWHEALDYYREPNELEDLLKSKGALYGHNQWPETPTEFKSTYELYINKMKILGIQIMRLMALGLDLDEHFFDRFVDDPFWVIRVIGYPNLRTKPDTLLVENKDSFVGEVGISCGEHTDYGCLTMVNQDNTQGALQVRSPAGQWIDANPIEGTFVMNLGDILKIWTKGRYQSTLHRVMNTNSDYRISVPFFFEPNFRAIIKPLEGLKTEGDVETREFLYGDHLISKVNYNFQPSPIPTLGPKAD